MTGLAGRIWRHYDLAGLDAQLSLNRIENTDALFARRQKAADAALSAFACEQGLRYGSGARQTLNLFNPPGAIPASGWPVLLFIHGGFWRSLDANLFSFLAPGFVPFGVALAAINYPLMPLARMEDVVDSCFAALGFLGREAAALGLDPKRLFVSGNSAGGHLVAELIDAGGLRARGFAPDAVAGACALSGLFDLEAVRLSSLNAQIGLTPRDVAAFSPLRRDYIPAAPAIVTAGGDETEEFLDQTRDYADLCSRAGAWVEPRTEPGMNHITVVLDALAAPEHGLNRSLRRMIGAG